MNRSILERELKKAGVTLKGWMPVLQCDDCKLNWEPFNPTVGASAPTAKFDYWQCPNKCNSAAQVSHQIKTALPRYVVINDVPGMLFGDEDQAEFETYVRSMDATIVPGRVKKR
ncbi:MAG: hypothetical protein ACREBG_20760 [Pyrinomonadaceae bacterium]